MPHAQARGDGRPPSRRPVIAGSAVLEGVFLRSAHATAVAVRRPSGEVVVRLRLRRTNRLIQALAMLPFVRGVVGLCQSVWLGFLAHLFALQQANLFAPLADATLGTGNLPRRGEGAGYRRRTWMTLGAWAFWSALGFLLVLGGVPLIFADLAQDMAAQVGPAWAPCAVRLCRVSGALAAVALMTGYVTVVGSTRALRRQLAYHGAEHRVRAAYAAGAAPTLDGVAKYPHIDAHCAMGRGVVLVALGFAVSWLFAWAMPSRCGLLCHADACWGELAGAALMRGLCIILAAGPYDELRRLARAWPHIARPVSAALAGPGRWLCAGVVAEPDLATTEVAIAALLRLIEGESTPLTLGGTPVPVPYQFADAWRRREGPFGTAPSRRVTLRRTHEFRGARTEEYQRCKTS